MVNLDTLNGSTKAEFVSLLGDIYEHSPWIAESLFTSATTPFDSVTSLHVSMKAVLDSSSASKKLEVINAHPDLAGKAALAGTLTSSSTSEQAGAGLGDLTREELDSFTAMNAAYKEKFGSVFILAVRNLSKLAILGALEARLGNSREREREECLAQVHKIAWMRLREAVECRRSGFLTCHVLDTASGKPAGGMRVSLARLSGGGERELLGEYVTNGDGRLEEGPALKGAAFTAGEYEWVFRVGDYFVKECQKVDGQPFLGEVPVRFGIDNPEEHYHVPLLCSPYSFSTYRGS